MNHKIIHTLKISVWVLAAISTGMFLAHAGGRLFALETTNEATDIFTIHEEHQIPLRTVTIGWVGDIAPGTDSRYQGLFAQLGDTLKTPEIMSGNLEGALTERGDSKCGFGAPLCFAFRGPGSFATLLKENGFDMINIANNHSFDFGNDGYQDTKQALEEASLLYTGAPKQITYIESSEKIKIGFIGFSTYDWAPSLLNYDTISSLVTEAKQNADIVVVFFHAGSEGSAKTATPKEYEFLGSENRGFVQKAAYTAVDAGADLILGSGPHVLRGMEFYKGKLIAYSLGNFAGIQSFKTTGDLGISGVLSITLDEGGSFVLGNVVPVRLSKEGIPSLDSSNTAWEQIRTRSFDDFGPQGVRITDHGILY